MHCSTISKIAVLTLTSISVLSVRPGFSQDAPKLSRDAPKDEFLYLTSHCDVDAFRGGGDDTGGGETGDLDGQSTAFPVDALPEGRRMEFRSQRFGKISFLRPKLSEGKKNAVTLRGQTIKVRTKKSFNWIATLGAAHPNADDTTGRQSGDYSGWLTLTFTDGTTAKSPIGFSNWAGEARFGEEIAAEASARPDITARRSGRIVRGATTFVQPARYLSYSGFQLRLWLQRSPIPEGKVLQSIQLPDLPNAKLIGITLARRDGFSIPSAPAGSAPKSASVAVFYEPGFPSESHNGLTPASIVERLAEKKISAVELRLDHILSGALTPDRFPVLVLPYGDVFPTDAADAFRKFRAAGGATVHTGTPFGRPATRAPYGKWLLKTTRDAAPYHGHGDSPNVGIAPPSNITATTIRPDDQLAEWGLKDLPWDRVSLGTSIISLGRYGGFDTRREYPSTELTPLIHVGSWTTPVALTLHQTGDDFKNCLDVCALTGAPWVDGLAATNLQREFVARGCAWALHQKEKITAEQWKTIATPFEGPLSDGDANVTPAAKGAFAVLGGPKPFSGDVRWVSVKDLSDEDRVLAASAQGLVHRRGDVGVYLLTDDSEEGFLEQLVEKKYVSSVSQITMTDLVDLARQKLAVVVDADRHGSLNLATMVAAKEGLLVAYPGVVETYGLTAAADLRTTFSDQAEMLRFAREHLLDSAHPTIVADIPPEPWTWQIRDLLVERGIFAFHVEDLDRSSVDVPVSDAALEVETLLATRPLLSSVLADPTPAPTAGVSRRFTQPSSMGQGRAERFGLRRVQVGSLGNLSFLSRISPKNAKKSSANSEEVKLEMGKVYVATYADGTHPMQFMNQMRSIAQLAAQASQLEELRARLARTGQALPRGFPGAGGVFGAAAAAQGPRSDSLGLDDLIPARDELLSTDAVEKATGLAFDLSFDPSQFGSGYGDAGRKTAMNALIDAIRGEVEQRKPEFLVLPSTPKTGTWDELIGKIPGELPVLIRGQFGSASADPIGAFRMVGDVPVVEDLGYPAIRQLLTETSLKTYRSIFPLFLAMSASSYANLKQEVEQAKNPPTEDDFGFGLVQQIGGVRTTQEALEPVDLSNVVLVTPAQLGSLAKRAAKIRRIEVATLIDGGGEWKYHDGGEDLGKTWRRPSYDDSKWSTGKGEFGYGDGGEGRPEATELKFGEDAAKKHPCYYFRKTFEIKGDQKIRLPRMELIVDDGCVVYLNGEEIGRVNMPEGDIEYATFAAGAFAGPVEYTWRPIPFDLAKLQPGKNTIAVEVHQGGASSSDLSFDLRLRGYRAVKPSEAK